MYRMLRQALMTRSALILLDGLDEAGTLREQIERHVAEVLAPQGHLMVVTSRPSGLSDERFAHFHRVHLRPLDEEQQREVVRMRVGAERAVALIDYLETKVPLDTETKLRVTGNPVTLQTRRLLTFARKTARL